MSDQLSFEALFRRWSRKLTLSAEDRAAFVALPWTLRSFPRDGYLIREGDRPTVCNILVQGFAFRQKLVTSGARQIISFHIPGELLDLQNLFLETADHNVQCLTRCVMAVVPRRALQELMTERPAIRRAIFLDSLIDAAVFREWVVNVGRRNARQRIAHLLCELTARLRASGVSDGSVYDFPITQEQIADATGMTPVHTNRTLQSLRRDGLISLSSNLLRILQWEGLSEVGDFNERYLHHSV